MGINQQTPHALGRAAEKAAELYLTAQGLTLVTRNFHGQRGEIDLIMLDGSILVFVEVRNRKNNRFGSAIETIDVTKQAKLIKTAELYLATNRSARKDKSGRLCRFDTVDFDGEITERNLRWIKNAFSA